MTKKDSKNNKKNANKTNAQKQEQDIVNSAKEKTKFLDNYYKMLLDVEDSLSINDMTILTKSLEVATLEIKEREAAKKREEQQKKQEAERIAAQKKREREEQRKLIRESTVVIGDESFTYISNNILLLDHYLFDEDNNSYGIFDEQTNIYEDSVAKERVDEWFEENIEPIL